MKTLFSNIPVLSIEGDIVTNHDAVTLYEKITSEYFKKAKSLDKWSETGDAFEDMFSSVKLVDGKKEAEKLGYFSIGNRIETPTYVCEISQLTSGVTFKIDDGVGYAKSVISIFKK